jgi:hypothetical protein
MSMKWQRYGPWDYALTYSFYRIGGPLSTIIFA